MELYWQWTTGMVKLRIEWTITGPIEIRYWANLAYYIGPVEFRCARLNGPNTNCQVWTIRTAVIGPVLGRKWNVCWGVHAVIHCSFWGTRECSQVFIDMRACLQVCRDTHIPVTPTNCCAYTPKVLQHVHIPLNTCEHSCVPLNTCKHIACNTKHLQTSMRTLYTYEHVCVP